VHYRLDAPFLRERHWRLDQETAPDYFRVGQRDYLYSLADRADWRVCVVLLALGFAP
jgi:hypothetical protein